MTNVQNRDAWFSEVARLKRGNNWDAIVRMIPFKDLESSWLWNDVACLNEAAFAIGQKENSLPEPPQKIKTPQDKAFKDKYDKTKNDSRFWFLKIINRSIELSPDNITSRSAKAYYLYNRYISSYRYKEKEHDGNIACLIYKEIPRVSERYKDCYRYVNLKRVILKNQNSAHINNKELPYVSYSAWKETLTSFRGLIWWHDRLEDNLKKRFTKEYNESKYKYASVFLSHMIEPKKLLSFRFNIYTPSDKTLKKWKNDSSEFIPQIVQYLDDVYQSVPHSISKSTLEDYKPHMLDILYREVQCYLVMGLLNELLVNKREKAKGHYTKAAELGEELYRYVGAFEKIKAKFNRPNYAYPYICYAYYLLEDFEKADFYVRISPPHLDSEILNRVKAEVRKQTKERQKVSNLNLSTDSKTLSV